MAGRPLRVLNVAEKPSVAKEASRILNGGGLPQSMRHQGVNYNAVWMFGATVQNRQCDMRFTSITGASSPAAATTRTHTPPGHLLESEFSPQHRSWRGCQSSDLIDPSRSKLVTNVRKDCGPLQAMLQKEAATADWLILWLDCDREGEAIAEEARLPERRSKAGPAPSRARRRCRACAKRPTAGCW